MLRITNQDEARKCAKDCNGEHPHVDGAAAFDVPGAGTLILGQYQSRTGGAVGLYLDVSWSKHGYSGGVMDRKELIALRDYLNAYLDNTHVVNHADTDEADEPTVTKGT